MSDRRIVVLEADPNDPKHGELYALDASQATAMGLPAFNIVATRPPIGGVTGEAVYETVTGNSYIWNGSSWQKMIADAIKEYATDADLLRDTSVAAGVYAISTATGNVYAKSTSGWVRVGNAHYATTADLLGDAPPAGTFASADDAPGLWEMTPTGWRILTTRQFTNTAAVVAWTTAAGMGGNVGDVAIAIDVDVTYVRTAAGWKPTSIYADTEANIRAVTWALNSQEAIATDTNRRLVFSNNAWHEEPIQHYATDALLKAATPPDGTLAWADDTGAVYARSAGQWIGIVTAFNDPVPVGTIMAFPTQSIPNGWLRCDGAAIPAGTDYDDLRAALGVANVPNLVGEFLRGGSATDTLLARTGWSTGKPHTDFTGVTSTNGNHRHDLTMNRHPAHFSHDVNPYNPGGSIRDAVEHTDYAGNHNHNVTINGGGDAETAPDHVRVVYCIKARHVQIAAMNVPVHVNTPRTGDAMIFDAASQTWSNKQVGVQVQEISQAAYNALAVKAAGVLYLVHS